MTDESEAVVSAKAVVRQSAVYYRQLEAVLALHVEETSLECAIAMLVAVNLVHVQMRASFEQSGLELPDKKLLSDLTFAVQEEVTRTGAQS